MNSTEPRYAKLAVAFFDEALASLARERQASGSPAYFPAAPDGIAETYFEAPSPVGRMTAADFECSGAGTPSGLIEALEKHWKAEGETLLAQAAPRLRSIADALAEANDPQTAEVDIFCYTLF